MVKFKGKFNKKIFDTLYKRNMKGVYIAMGILCAIITVIGIIGIIFGEDSADLGSAIYLIVLGVIFIPCVVLQVTSISKSLRKRTPFMNVETDEEFDFGEDEITILQVREGAFKGFTQAKYDYFYKVVESDTAYFLYISPQQCHVVLKEYLIEGTLEQLNEILSSQLHEKFKPYTKSSS